MKKRVAVTGCGVIAPNGIGRQKFWDALEKGLSGVRRITLFDPAGFPCQIAGEVSDFQPLDYFDRKEIRKLARFSQFAAAAARMAINDARLTRAVDRRRPGLVALGVSTSALDFIEKEHRSFLKKGPASVSPYGILSASPHAATSEVIRLAGIPAVQVTLANECTSGLNAIGLAFQKIRDGEAALAICGGTDAPITPLMWAGFCQSGLVPFQNEQPATRSRPFDLLRTVGIISEGAAIFILEELETARRRSAPVYAEIAGFGMSSEDSEAGVAAAMRAALDQDRRRPEEVDYISAHAPSHTLIDRMEVRAVRQVFRQAARRLPVSSIKSMIGNPLSAGGALQLASVLMAFDRSVIPPTINYEVPDPECDLDCVPNRARLNRINLALVNSHGIGGSNSSLLLKKCVT